MILQALNDYYERLAADPDSGVASFGYSRQQIAFVVVLEKDGSLHDIQDAGVTDAKGKRRNRAVVVPGNAKPSGSGINPCFLWDNAAYMLGFKLEDPKPKRTRESFEAFRARHLEAEQAIDDPQFSAVCRFLEAWNPDDAGKYPAIGEGTTGFGVFQFRNVTGFVHEQPAVRAWWDKQAAIVENDQQAKTGQCLVTGRIAPIARLHEPKIKGVYGAQSSGASLSSFNCAAFESYGKRQSLGSPVSEQAAFQYATALNRLLDPSTGRRMSVGDTSVVFWTDKPSPAEGLLADILNPSTSAEDESRLAEIRPLIDAIAQGKFPPQLGSEDVKFYVLGLAPNAARISVRFWYESTLGELVEHLHRHFEALEIAQGPNDLPHPPLWRLLRETARETKDIPDLLEGALLRSILTGQPYPQMFFSALLRRLKADRDIRHVRAAAIKACLVRSYDVTISKELDDEFLQPAYLLGRLFAVLEKCQYDSNPSVDGTLRARYLARTIAAPALIYPQLLNLNRHHMAKLRSRRDQPKKLIDWLVTRNEELISKILWWIDDIPNHLIQRDQGVFAVGYYHQNQKLWQSRTEREPSSSQEDSQDESL